MILRLMRPLGYIAVATVLASCEPMVDMRGHTLDEADFKQIVVGQSREEDVAALLGSPTTRSNFGDNTWYYVTEKKETYGMFAPKVAQQQVTAIRFNPDLTVAEILDYGLKDSKPVTLVTKTTPTEGKKMTAIEQILGNVGRFGTPGRQVNPRDLGR